MKPRLPIDKLQAVDRLRWCIPDLLATSGRPGRDKGKQHSPTLEDMRAWAYAAKAMGLRTIICFLENKRLAKWYGGLYPTGLLGYYKDQGFEVFHFPAEDLQAEPDDVKKASLKAFNSAPKPVVLQDSGGVDRTGAVAKYIVKVAGAVCEDKKCLNSE